jgi:hypothetical protein
LGVNYPSVAWRHPLTPYRSSTKEPDKFLPVLTPDGGRLFYNNWLDITIGVDKNFHLAKCIEENNCGIDAKILCFGYEHENFKPLVWVESVTPYYKIQDSIREPFLQTINTLVTYASTVAKSLFLSIEKKPDRGDKKRKQLPDNGDKALHEFWSRTESKFFDIVEQRYFELNRDETSDDKILIGQWYQHLYIEVLKIFSEYVESGRFDLEMQVLAKNKLKQKLKRRWDDGKK